MTGPAPAEEFWLASGHPFCDRDGSGRLLATADLWRVFLTRPELHPPDEAGPCERALFLALRDDPLQPVLPERLAGLEDRDAAENWTLFLAFRDRVAAQPSLEAAWCNLYRTPLTRTPPLLLQMLTHLVTRAALDGVADAFTLRAGELFFRPQRAAIHHGATLLADVETLEAAHGGYGTLDALLAEAGAPPREVELDVLSTDNAAGYRGRSDAHDLALDVAEGRPGAAGLARAIERFCAHVLDLPVTVRPVPVIEDARWNWHVGLDAEATSIANALWHGETVAQARLARLLWLGVLEFTDPRRVLSRMRGRPVYLALAMDAAGHVRLKPQNLLVGLPLEGSP